MKINEIFDACLKLTMSKRHDYTSTIDNHENFKRSAIIGEWFKSNDDKPYVILIGTKLARLGSLLDSKEPKNESIEDTFLDLINYCALWAERRSNIEKRKCAICGSLDYSEVLARVHGQKLVDFCCLKHLDNYFSGLGPNPHTN